MFGSMDFDLTVYEEVDQSLGEIFTDGLNYMVGSFEVTDVTKEGGEGSHDIPASHIWGGGCRG
jgi:hypothetical protein